MKISPSILAADLIDLRNILKGMDDEVVDLLHLDVMDGHFVPAISFGELISQLVAGATSIPPDVHLMVSRPEREISKYFTLKPFNITFHIEATDFPIRLAQLIRAEGIRAGVALNPGTAVNVLEPLLDEIDLILIMSVEPGFYGQKFIRNALDKITAVKEMIGGHEILIQVDGGVSTDNVELLERLGVDIAVAGSACFKSGNVNDNIKKLKSTAAGVR